MKTDLPIFTGTSTEQWQKQNLQSRIRALEESVASSVKQIDKLLSELEKLDKRLQALEP